MTARRWRTVALQAVAVGALVAVAFAIFLRPQGEDMWSGIRAPTKPQQLVRNPDQRSDRHGRDRGQGREGRHPGEGRRVNRPGGFGGSGVASELAAGSPGAAVGGPPGDGAEGPAGESPTADQYADAVTRLTAGLY